MITTSQIPARYLIAQYVDDTRRMESRNIGVIVWAPGAVACRFVGHDPAREIVSDPGTYDRWVRFWESKTAPETLSLYGQSTSKRSAEYVSALLGTQKRNYQLREGGETLNDVDPSEVGDIADQLFRDLVDVPQPRVSMKRPHEDTGTLFHKCTEIFESLGVARDYRLSRNKSFNCSVMDTWQNFVFHYMWGDNYAEVLFERVDLTRQESANSAFMQFEWVQRSNTLIVKNARLISFVDASQIDENASRRIQLLEKVSDVIDCFDRQAQEKVALLVL